MLATMFRNASPNTGLCFRRSLFAFTVTLCESGGLSTPISRRAKNISAVCRTTVLFNKGDGWNIMVANGMITQHARESVIGLIEKC